MDILTIAKIIKPEYAEKLESAIKKASTLRKEIGWLEATKKAANEFNVQLCDVQEML